MRLDQNHLLKCYGYQILRHGDLKSYNSLKQEFSDWLHDKTAQFIKRGSLEGWSLESYHNALEGAKVDHHALIKEIKRQLPNEFSHHPYIKKMVAVASDCTKTKLKIYNDKLEFRVCRPSLSDNNPLHRDHWFPYFTPLLNVYLPMSGSYVDSAMQVVPRSHLWSDEDVVPTFPYEGGKPVKGSVAYSVPEIASSAKKIEPHRPDIIPGDFMLFSPLCVHGGGSNSSHETRFSFEIRLTDEL